MKKLLPFLLISSLLLSACSVWNKDDLFEKKIECAKFLPELEKKILNWNKITENWWDVSYGYGIEEIFYSPFRNSCKAVVSSYINPKISPNDFGKYYEIIDLLTYERQAFITGYKNSDEAYPDFLRNLQELKWE